MGNPGPPKRSGGIGSAISSATQRLSGGSSGQKHPGRYILHKDGSLTPMPKKKKMGKRLPKYAYDIIREQNELMKAMRYKVMMEVTK